MPTTITSLDVPHTHLDASVPPQFLRHLIVSSLKRRGFEAAEAGALVEMERLLERHVQNLFQNAKEWSDLAGRASPNAMDLLASTSEQRDSKKLKRESKRRRRRPKLETITAPQSPPPRQLLTDLRDYMASTSTTDDVKPNLMDEERRLEGAYEGAPSLPGKWTYARDDTDTVDGSTDKDPPSRLPQVTPASLEFVKSTVAEKGIDPELGIVHYRKGRAGKRKWNVAGAGG